MFLKSLALSKKLFAALLLPVALFIGLLGLRTADALQVRNVAEAQAEEVERFRAVNAFADALLREGRVYFNFASTDADVTEARTAVDTQLAALRDPELALPIPILQRMVDIHAELLASREVLGDNVVAMRIQGQREVLADGDLVVAGTVTSAINVPTTLTQSVVEAYDFDPDAISGPEQGALLASYALVQTVRSSYSAEVTGFLGATQLPEGGIDDSITEFIGASIAQSDRSVQTLRAVATPEIVALLEELLDGVSYSIYEPVREQFDDIDPVGVEGASAQSMSRPSTAAVNEVGDLVDTEFDNLALDALARIDASSAAEVDSANRQLLESLVLGALTLLVVGIILFGLYRSIRNPLRELTDRSTEIAEVELPSVVATMRTGDGKAPEITEIRAQTTDEIGELTDAFNGMYRTAIELASEQAASRRVVADMFVNLGRRNQKLLNRMLKGLGQLEQEEQDPDTLGALYKVDQLATRMRRNAESLLILAGAGQSRTFRRDVPVYEVVQSALSEVENFQRVDVDVSSDLLMKGIYVADVAHLLAELIENALVFSPPSTTVEVLSRETARGFIIAVVDNGVGMPEQTLNAANARIRGAADQTETPSEFLGHYVVGRLAARHGIEVDMLEGAASGTVARIVLPLSVLASEETVEIDPVGAPAELTSPTAIEPANDALAEITTAPTDINSLTAAPTLTAEPETGFGADEAVVRDDSLGAFSAGVARAEDAPDTDDAGSDVAGSDVAGSDVAGSDDAEPAVADLDWAQVDADLALGSTALDADTDGAGTDDDADALTLVDAADTPEIVSDFGAPAGESIPLPRVDASRPLYEPSVYFPPANGVDSDPVAPVADPTPIADAASESDTESDTESAHIEAADIEPVDTEVIDAQVVDAEVVETDPVESEPVEMEPVVETEPQPEFAMTAATASVEAEPTVFGFARREPGASLPVRQRRKPAAESTTDDSDESDNTPTPDDLRSSLSGFQTGVVRAEKETH